MQMNWAVTFNPTGILNFYTHRKLFSITQNAPVTETIEINL